MTTELAIIIPAVLLVLVIVVNVGMFVAELARFDRVTGEVARILVRSPEDPADSAQQVLQAAMGYEDRQKGPYQLQVDVEKSGELFLQKRVLHFTLNYELFATGLLANTGASNLPTLTRSKTLVIYWSTGL
ncbi:MAG: hypothetical protein FWC86_05860 [Coriobacteriia bacterium]|nr:hypothetical protein [Coriobacteriia bacterium]